MQYRNPCRILQLTFRNRNFMLFRSSRPEVFCKKGVLWNFAKFIGKYLCQSLFLINLQAAPATLLKMRPWGRYFPVDFAKFLRTPFLQNYSGRLLLTILVFCYENIFHYFPLLHKAWKISVYTFEASTNNCSSKNRCSNIFSQIKLDD